MRPLVKQRLLLLLAPVAGFLLLSAAIPRLGWMTEAGTQAYLLYFVGLSWALAVYALRAERIVMLITLGAIAVMGWRMAGIQPFDSPLDVTAHLAPIDYMVAHGRISPASNSAIHNNSHQPPLYYIASALIEHIARTAGALKHMVVLYSALGYFTVFLIYAVRLALRVLHSSPYRYAAVAAMVLWPANLFHCCRISNDEPLYAALMATLYYLVAWLQEGKRSHFAAAVLATSVAFLIKSSALICVLLIGAALLIRWWRAGALRPVLATLPGRSVLLVLALVLLACAAHNFVRLTAYRYGEVEEGKGMTLLTGNVKGWEKGMTGRITIGWHTYFGFNLNAFIKRPFWEYHNDRSDRSYFWNYHLKSYLFSMEKWQRPFIAKLLNVCLLLLVVNGIGMLAYYAIYQRETGGMILPMAGFHAIITGCMIAMQLAYPEVGYADTRHTYPVVMLFILIYVALLERLAPTGTPWQRANKVLASGFGVLALYFIAAQL